METKLKKNNWQVRLLHFSSAFRVEADNGLCRIKIFLQILSSKRADISPGTMGVEAAMVLCTAAVIVGFCKAAELVPLAVGGRPAPDSPADICSVGKPGGTPPARKGMLAPNQLTFLKAVQYSFYIACSPISVFFNFSWYYKTM